MTRKSSLHRNALPALLLGRLQAGEEKTYKEWGIEFKTTVEKIGTAIRRLRKRGYMYYPIGTICDPFNGNQGGIVKNVMDSKRYIQEVTGRNDSQEITPRILSAFRLMEEVVIEFPELLSQIESGATKIVMLAMNRKEQLKQLNNEDSEPRIKQD